MTYDIHTTSMLIGSISEDELKIIFNPKLQKLYTGDSIKVIDEQKQGIVAQVYQIENLDYTNITDETLKSQTAHLSNISTESFAEEIGSLHIAKCKIKLSIINNKWLNWRGNLPSLNDFADIVPPSELISHTIGSSPLNPLNIGQFVSYKPVPLNLEAGLLERTTLIVGDKAKEKTNLLNILQEELIRKKARVIVIDSKGSYTNFPEARLLVAGQNFKLSLAEYGLPTLGSIVTGQTEPNLKIKIENLYMQLSNHVATLTKDFIPLKLLRDLLEKEMSTPEGQKRFNEMNTLRNRLIAIEKLGIFANNPEDIIHTGNIFKEANLAILDISSIPLFWQKIFIKNCVKDLIDSDVCPFVFYDDLHKYIDQEMCVDLLYKTRNLGLNNIFLTTYEDEIPVEIIKQADNLFMFSTDMLENNPMFFNNLKSDRTLLDMLLKRAPENTVVVYGDLTNNYPVMVELRETGLQQATNKHFGSIRKHLSEYGEIVYSYKSAAETPAVHNVETHHAAQHQDSYDYYNQPAAISQQHQHEEYPAATEEPFAPSSFQQSGYLETYKNLSEEYEDEFLTGQMGINFDEEGEEPEITFHPQEKPHQQVSPGSIAHHIPDEEFYVPQQQQASPGSLAHHIPDEEFYVPQQQPPQQRPPQQQRPQQQMPPQQQQPQQQRQQQQRPQQRPPESFAHHIPDEDFLPQQMPPQQPQQQRPQQPHPQQRPPESFAHHIPDEDFLPQQMPPQQPQQQRPQQPRPQQRPPESFAHHIPDEEFLPQQMPPQQKQQPPQQDIKQAYTQHSAPLKPESIPEHVEDIPVYASSSMDTTDLEFQEGDQVQHERYGTGVINRIIITGDKKLCSIQFQEFGRRLLDPNRGLKKIN